MDPEQIALIRASFGRVEPIAETAAALFYARLFELDPALRPLFRGDLQVQGRALMGMLRVVVRGLDRLEQLVPAVQALGRRHATRPSRRPPDRHGPAHPRLAAAFAPTP